MNAFQLGRCLGDITASSFKRYYLHQQLQSLEHNSDVSFDSIPISTHNGAPISNVAEIAHKGGTNCIAIDQNAGRFLLSGGADTAIRLWDLESCRLRNSDHIGSTCQPLSTISKISKSSHSHAITSLSIYPHDPSPTTLLSTSYDQCLLLSSITPASLQPLHKFPLDFTAYTHAVSPLPSASPLVAVGTAHPSPRLIDLRSALATHALPGHTGAIYSLAWHPRREHIILSSSTDGRILAFDIRRATPAFASFDVDDNLGIIETNSKSTLDYTARAHSSAITGIVFNDVGDKLVSASHDQRIRVWDVASGRNDLVHFGARIRNVREGELKPVFAPGKVGAAGMKTSGEVLFWPNDDGRGEIFMHEVREGSMLRVLKTKNVVQLAPGASGTMQKKGGRGNRRIGGEQNMVGRLTSGGRINSLAFRPVTSEDGLGESLEMYSAHGDGRVCAWMPGSPANLDEEEGGSAEDDENEDECDGVQETRIKKTKEELDAEKSRKRKRDLIEGLVEGLTKRPVTFS